jgi:hypothetical protein
MPFEIDASQPPSGARPVSNNYTFTLPEPRALSGQGVPIMATGRPELAISFDRLTETGWNWWAALTGEDLSASVSSIQFWNPYKSGGGGWDTWTGGAIVHRPTFDDIEHGSYLGVQIRITEMVES